MNKNFLKLAKFLFGFCLIFILYRDLNWEELSQALGGLDYGIVLLFCFLYFLSQTISALKWSVLLKALGNSYPFKKVFRAYFFGMFVNCFALGTIGGDASRAMSLSGYSGSGQKKSFLKKSVVASVVFDRIHGLVVLLGLGVFALALKHGVFFKFFSFTSLLLLLLAYFCKRDAFLTFKNFRDPWSSLLVLLNYRVLLSASLLSLTSHLLQILMFSVLLVSYCDIISPIQLLSTVPFINLGSALPFSVNGLGVRDWLLAIYFQTDYLSLEARASISTIWIFCTGAVAALVAFFLTLQGDCKTIELAKDGAELEFSSS